MKKWNFKVNQSPAEINENLEKTLGTLSGYEFNLKKNNGNLQSFKIRKRLLYAWYIIYHNNVIVNGKLAPSKLKDETIVEISFSQHFLWKFVIFTYLLIGLMFIIAISFGGKSVFSYLIAATTLGIGIFLWFRLQKKYTRNVEEYKSLLSHTLKL